MSKRSDTPRQRAGVATVRVSLTSYGKASYRYQQAAEKAEMCEHPTGEEATRWNGHDRCNAMAKFTLQGMNVCGKHASYILLQAAYKAGLRK